MSALLSKLETLRVNPDWAKLPLFDRKGWKRVRFGDVVENINETCDPNEAGLGRFIAMEHLEPGSLHIRKWGNVADGTTFTRRCQPGQVLFGKRRAYQRKVAVAEFDAVVSGDIYVFAAKNDRLLPELLPFICISERFFKFSVETSAGSLSPRTNWSNLADFEFDIPPLSQQRRIADILWATDRAIAAAITQLDCANTLKYSAFRQRTTYDKTSFPVRTLGDVTMMQYGLSCPLSESGKYPILRMMNYDEEIIAATDLKYADMPEKVARDYTLERGDILFNRTNSAELVGKVGIFQMDDCYLFASYLVRIKTDKQILLPEFLNYYLNSDIGQAAIRAYATPGVSQTNISAGSLKKVKIPVPALSRQLDVVAELIEISEMKRFARNHVEIQKSALLELINTLLV